MNKTSNNAFPVDFGDLESFLEQMQYEALKDLNSRKINPTDRQYYLKIVLKSLMLKASCVCRAVLIII
jgi:hypothetical protein